MGARISDPSVNAKASGTMPNTMASVVIKIGRKRTLAASSSAALRSRPGAGLPSALTPGWRARMAKSTSKIAFLVTKPMSMMMPITENIESVELNISKASTTPIKVSGSAVISARGCKKLLNWLAKIM